MDTQKIQIDTGIEKLKLSYSETPSTSNTKTNILLIHGFLGNILVYQPIIDQLKNLQMLQLSTSQVLVDQKHVKNTL